VAMSAIDAISPAFQHTKQQLFQPFRAGQWAKLALVGFLAGELTSGGCNLQMPSGTTSGTNRFDMPPLPHLDPAVVAGLIAFLIVFGSVVFLLFLYVNSVMRFVLFDAVIEKTCAIRRAWSRRNRAGLRYFVWQLLFYLVGPVVIALVIGIPVLCAVALGWIKDPKQHLVVLILGGMALFFLFFVFVIVWLLVHVFTKDFVVPQMAIEDVTAFEGWRRLLPQLSGDKGSYAGYVAMKIVMTLGVAVVVGIVAFIVILILLIPFGGLGAVAVLLGKAAGLQWNLYTISLAVIVLFVFLLVVLYAISLISVPAIVFFPAYSIYFFAARYPALDTLLHPVPPPAVVPPPVLPPAPGFSG